MARLEPCAFNGLRAVLFGGEAVDPDCVRRILQNKPPDKLLHVYGPTESTTFATSTMCEAAPGYTVFGELESGFEVLDAIGAVSTTSEVPNDPIFITSVELIQ